MPEGDGLMDQSRMMQQAMAEWGRLAHQTMAGDVAAFAALGLNATEQLSALAGSAAACTMKRHGATPGRFLAQLQQLTRLTSSAASRHEDLTLGEMRDDTIGKGLDLLAAGFDRLVARLTEAGAPPERAAAVEAVLLARLLANYRPHLVRLAMLAAAAGLARPDYRAGDLVPFIAAEAAEDGRSAARPSQPAMARAG
jgi:hypothetical protein